MGHAVIAMFATMHPNERPLHLDPSETNTQGRELCVVW